MTVHRKQVTMSVHVPATDEELINIGQRVSEQYSLLGTVELEKKDTMNALKEKLNRIEAEIQSSCEQIKTRKIYVPQASVVEEWDTDAEIYRCTWLGRLVFERPFNQQDRELFCANIFDIGEEKIKTKKRPPNTDVQEVMQLEKNVRTKKDHTV